MNNPFSLVFAHSPNILTALSVKTDGTMRLRGDDTEQTRTSENRKNYFNALGIQLHHVVSAGLVHGNNVVYVTKKDGGEIMDGVDGLITDEKELFLLITVADCLPVYLYDSVAGVIGIVHAGWRGLAQSIISNCVTKMSKHYGGDPSNLVVGLGPAISQAHYEVRDDVLDHFKKMPAALVSRNKRTYLNLKEVAKQQLLDLGVGANNIEISDECTYSLPNKYFSYRRGKPRVPNTMIAVIGIRNR